VGFSNTDRQKEVFIRCGRFVVWDHQAKEERKFDSFTGIIIGLAQGLDKGNETVRAYDTLDIRMLDTDGSGEVVLIRAMIPSTFTRSFSKFLPAIHHGDKITITLWSATNNKKVTTGKVLIWQDGVAPKKLDAIAWEEEMPPESQSKDPAERERVGQERARVTAARNKLALQRFHGASDLWETPGVPHDESAAEGDAPEVSPTTTAEAKPRPPAEMKMIAGEEFDVATSTPEEKKMPAKAHQPVIDKLNGLFAYLFKPEKNRLALSETEVGDVKRKVISLFLEDLGEQTEAAVFDDLTLYQAKLIGRFAAKHEQAWSSMLQHAVNFSIYDPFADE